MDHAPSIASQVQQMARALGFHLAGIAPVAGADDGPPEAQGFSQWVAEGRAGEMEYLKRRDASGAYLRSSLRVPFPWARSVIVCAVSYNTPQPRSIDPAPEGTGWIARYAWSGRAVQGEASGNAQSARTEATDYHAVVLERLELLKEKLQVELGTFIARCFVDTGPVAERTYAQHAGLGWQGKNTCLIHEKFGSWIFLGTVVTSLELPREEWAAPHADRCGSCTRCLDACPTQCLTPYRMDASRCIAYLTIEKRGEIAKELQPAIGRNVFGCDICQEVCPWNRRAPVTDWPELSARPELVNPALEWLSGLDEAQFRAIFRKSPVSRAKHAGLQRNVAIAMQNRQRQ
ncbi:MAG: tRNA epoxyqueuosine(34) reductase QueG [Acidobacteriaceae bacterium]